MLDDAAGRRDGHALLRAEEPDRRRSGPIRHDPA
jgi:hypothetical protein